MSFDSNQIPILSSCYQTEGLSNGQHIESLVKPFNVKTNFKEILTSKLKIEPQADTKTDITNFEIKCYLITPSRFIELKNEAKKAIHNKKIFRMRDPSYYVSRTLRNRGWVKLLEQHDRRRNHPEGDLTYSEAIALLPDISQDISFVRYKLRCEDTIRSEFLRRCPMAKTNFIWTKPRNSDEPMNIEMQNPDVLLSKVGKSFFSPKHVLAHCLRTQHWTYQGSENKVNFPRTYIIYDRSELNEFIVDYRNTAALGFLRYILDATNGGTDLTLFNKKSWKIPIFSIEFALNHCSAILESLNDTEFDVKNRFPGNDTNWDAFIGYHLMLLSGKQKLIERPNETRLVELINEAKGILSAIKLTSSQYHADGCRNIWILKPRNSYCGTGIYLTNKIEKIVDFSRFNYVVQKYIERPLRIYNTKGDIRQFLLITNIAPLQVWMYTNQYIRLCTQVFNLSNLHSSIHVTNIKIQNHYEIDPQRDRRLPASNMWSTTRFRAYLEEIGRPDAWDKIIFPGMKSAIIGSILSTEEFLASGPNNFELYGADFLVDEDLNPWLLEINQNPSLVPETATMRQLIPAMIEDMLKVVLDWKKDRNAPTGNFQLIYEQDHPRPSVLRKENGASQLSVVGKHFSRDLIKRELYNHLISLGSRRA